MAEEAPGEGLELQCPQCYEDYQPSGPGSEAKRIPRALHCGHLICTECATIFAEEQNYCCNKCSFETVLDPKLPAGGLAVADLAVLPPPLALPAGEEVRPPEGASNKGGVEDGEASVAGDVLTPRTRTPSARSGSMEGSDGDADLGATGGGGRFRGDSTSSNSSAEGVSHLDEYLRTADIRRGSAGDSLDYPAFATHTGAYRPEFDEDGGGGGVTCMLCEEGREEGYLCARHMREDQEGVLHVGSMRGGSGDIDQKHVMRKRVSKQGARHFGGKVAGTSPFLLRVNRDKLEPQPEPSLEDADPDYLRKHFFQDQKMISDGLALFLISECTKKLQEEPNVLHIQAPVRIVGDLHGQFFDLVSMLDTFGTPLQADHKGQYLFLGDYVDRGMFSCEILLYLMALKLRCPDRVHLIRGNHECRSLTQHFGFKQECERKCGIIAYNYFLKWFEQLPLCAVVTNDHGKYFCTHGGISPDLDSIADINLIKRDEEPPKNGIMCDLLWADPADDPGIVKIEDLEAEDLRGLLNDDGFKTNPYRGCSVSFGMRPVLNFLENNGLLTVIRAHAVQEQGYFRHFEKVQELLQAKDDGEEGEEEKKKKQRLHAHASSGNPPEETGHDMLLATETKELATEGAEAAYLPPAMAGSGPASPAGTETSYPTEERFLMGHGNGRGFEDEKESGGDKENEEQGREGMLVRTAAPRERSNGRAQAQQGPVSPSPMSWSLKNFFGTVTADIKSLMNPNSPSDKAGGSTPSKRPRTKTLLSPGGLLRSRERVPSPEPSPSPPSSPCSGDSSPGGNPTLAYIRRKAAIEERRRSNGGGSSGGGSRGKGNGVVHRGADGSPVISPQGLFYSPSHSSGQRSTDKSFFGEGKEEERTRRASSLVATKGEGSVAAAEALRRRLEEFEEGAQAHATAAAQLPPVITVFSAPNYCGRYGNTAAVLLIKQTEAEPEVAQYQCVVAPVPVDRGNRHQAHISALLDTCPYMPTTFRDFVRIAIRLGPAPPLLESEAGGGEMAPEASGGAAGGAGAVAGPGAQSTGGMGQTEAGGDGKEGQRHGEASGEKGGRGGGGGEGGEGSPGASKAGSQNGGGLTLRPGAVDLVVTPGGASGGSAGGGGGSGDKALVGRSPVSPRPVKIMSEHDIYEQRAAHDRIHELHPDKLQRMTEQPAAAEVLQEVKEDAIIPSSATLSVSQLTHIFGGGGASRRDSCPAEISGGGGGEQSSVRGGEEQYLAEKGGVRNLKRAYEKENRSLRAMSLVSVERQKIEKIEGDLAKSAQRSRLQKRQGMGVAADGAVSLSSTLPSDGSAVMFSPSAGNFSLQGEDMGEEEREAAVRRSAVEKGVEMFEKPKKDRKSKELAEWFKRRGRKASTSSSTLAEGRYLSNIRSPPVGGGGEGGGGEGQGQGPEEAESGDSGGGRSMREKEEGEGEGVQSREQGGGVGLARHVKAIPSQMRLEALGPPVDSDQRRMRKASSVSEEGFGGEEEGHEAGKGSGGSGGGGASDEAGKEPESTQLHTQLHTPPSRGGGGRGALEVSFSTPSPRLGQGGGEQSPAAAAAAAAAAAEAEAPEPTSVEPAPLLGPDEQTFTHAEMLGLKLLFSLMNLNDSDYIDSAALQMYAENENDHGLAKEVQACIDAADADGDGVIGLMDFTCFAGRLKCCYERGWLTGI